MTNTNAIVELTTERFLNLATDNGIDFVMGAGMTYTAKRNLVERAVAEIENNEAGTDAAFVCGTFPRMVNNSGRVINPFYAYKRARNLDN